MNITFLKLLMKTDTVRCNDLVSNHDNSSFYKRKYISEH
jgi:hypothetical protein